MPDNSRKEVIAGVVIVGLLAIVVFGKQIWRLSHREGTPIFSVETFHAFLPYLVAAAVLVVVLLGLDWMRGRRKSGPDAKD